MLTGGALAIVDGGCGALAIVDGGALAIVDGGGGVRSRLLTGGFITTMRPGAR